MKMFSWALLWLSTGLSVTDMTHTRNPWLPKYNLWPAYLYYQT